MKPLHLICNAHLDPVWQWEWEEGAAEAMSTFRAAADFCEEFDGFVFNHNEAVLYRWVEEYEPELFRRIQRLVAAGQWHIMGGWWIQPDCNMPSGESFVRQILLGKAYFLERFGVEPRTAINFDPFGHNRGLVQVLAKSGYDSYLFCRPFQNDCPLPSDDFTWVGFDGSVVTGHRASMFYNQPLGKATEKVQRWIDANRDKAVGLVLWGVGNHGGGPSRADLRALAAMKQECSAFDLLHSTPEAYFADLRASGTPLPRHEGDINPWAPGCYTSQVRLKQKHRLLENMLYQVEKMASAAALQTRFAYPADEIDEAVHDLLFAEFHDILPGSSVQPVEDAALRLMDHALEKLSRVRARAFFALAQGQPRAAAGEIPILVYNAHPYAVCGAVECEFQLPDVNFGEQFTVAEVHRDGQPVPCQMEKEHGNVAADWRKRVVFAADLAPASMNRFDCRLVVLPERPRPQAAFENGRFVFESADMEVVISRDTGLVERYSVDGRECITQDAFRLLVLADNEDPWGMATQGFRDVIGHFSLLSPQEGTRLSGITRGIVDSVRVIEDGDVRTVIEAVFGYERSFVVMHYRLPKKGAEFEVAVRVYWNEPNRMLKLSVPTAFPKGSYCGQVAFGVQPLPVTGREAVAQKWTAVVDPESDRALTCINEGVYGSDFADGELRLSLLRSAAYAGHPIHDRPIVPQDRHMPRIDIGERQYRFWFQGGPREERLGRVDREALAHNERPFALSFCPSGHGAPLTTSVILSDDVVQMTAFKKAAASSDYIIRLFEPTGQARKTMVAIPPLGIEQEIALGAFEVKTLRVDAAGKKLVLVDLVERG